MILWFFMISVNPSTYCMIASWLAHHYKKAMVQIQLLQVLFDVPTF